MIPPKKCLLAGCKCRVTSWCCCAVALFGFLPGAPVFAYGAPAVAQAEIEQDWLWQDFGVEAAKDAFTDGGSAMLEKAVLERVLAELGPAGLDLRAEMDAIIESGAPGNVGWWRDLYHRACALRRVHRVAPIAVTWPRWVYAKRYPPGSSHYAYTENLSSARYPERSRFNKTYRPGGSLNVMVLRSDGAVATQTLLADDQGMVRDPDVSWDGSRIVFSWRKHMTQDDYHIYEMEVATGRVRQLTHDLGHADIEPCYLPNGDILFNSTRCVQIVDCWWTDVLNLYVMDGEGRYMRRLGYDQVHTTYPTVARDGRVLYTRWDYNDRGQVYPQPLFQMNPDGTGQTEFYGNNSWFPTTILHARSIPGTGKVLAIITGHHSHQCGKLGVIDPARGRQEAAGVQLVAPVRETEAVRIDAYGQEGDRFLFPYPVDGQWSIVSYDPLGAGKRTYGRTFGLYLMNMDGRRELLAWDAGTHCMQAIPLAPRPRPPLRANQVDYRKKTGTFYVQDVYLGPGLKGVPRGKAKRLRVVALEFRPVGIGSNRNKGPAGSALVSTPVACNNGAWDVKRVLGTVPIEEDGSAFFEVPAETPVYFQVLDRKGHAIQTMRSWSTLMPGENFSCVGCHESKNMAPPVAEITAALRKGPRHLEPFHDVPTDRGFSFQRDVQPILDRNCTSCHFVRSKQTPATVAEGIRPSFSLLNDEGSRSAGRIWSDSYVALTKNGKMSETVNWISAQSVPTMLSPYSAGACTSRLMTMLENKHGDTALSAAEMETLACWIDLLVPYGGEYDEANAWTPESKMHYAQAVATRRAMEDLHRRNVQALLTFGETGRHANEGPAFEALPGQYAGGDGRPAIDR